MANKPHFVGQKRRPRQSKYCVVAPAMVVNRAKTVCFFIVTPPTTVLLEVLVIRLRE